MLRVGILFVGFQDVWHHAGGTTPNGYFKADLDSMLFSQNWWIAPQGNTRHPEGEEIFGGMRDYYWQMSRPNGSAGALVDHLSYHSRKQGAVDLTGRIEPRFMKSVSSKYFFVSPGRMWMLVHSAMPELLDAIHRGDAFLSRLEGDL